MIFFFNMIPLIISYRSIIHTEDKELSKGQNFLYIILAYIDMKY